MKIVDDLIERMIATTYQSGSDKTFNPSLLYRHDKNANQAMRQLLLEFIQQNVNDTAVENAILKQRVFVLEEIVKKSNFAPLILEPNSKVESEK